MGRPAKIDKFKVAEEIIELASKNEELTIYNLTKKLREISQKNNDPTLDVRIESVRRVLQELVRLKILAVCGNSRGESKEKKPYKLLWNPEKAKEIIKCWKEFYSLSEKLNILKHLADYTEENLEFSGLVYKFCPYFVLLGIDWIEGLLGFLGKFDWKTFIDKAVPLYGAVFSLRHDQELKVLNNDYIGGEFFVVSGENSCRFFEEARWVEYVARRKAKMEIENKLLEMFYDGKEFQCLSVHYGDGAETLSTYLFGVRYFIKDSRLVVFDFSPNPFLRGIDEHNIKRAFELLLENLQEKYPAVEIIQIRTVSQAMSNFLVFHGFKERERLYLYTKTEKSSHGSRFVVELSNEPPVSSEMEWIIRVFEKKVKS